MTRISLSHPARVVRFALSTLSVIAVAGLAPGAEPAPAIVGSEFIYDDAPTPSCHASTLVETTAGTLIGAWFGGTAEKNPDVGVWVARREKGKWSAPVEVANGVQEKGNDAGERGDVRYPCWNPVLFQPSKGPLLLFYKVGPSPTEWWGMLKSSDDDGRTWSAARRLPDGILGPIKNKPIELADGTILSPTSTESKVRPSRWQVHFERSSDGGKTWQATESVNDGIEWSTIQPSILRLGGDKLLALGRSRQGKVYRTTSDDAGKTWSAMTASGLPNPNSGTDALTLREPVQTSGETTAISHLLIYNHTTRGRSPLNLAASSDGLAWQAALVLEDEPNAEFSYPAIIQTRDGLVHLSWTWKRKKVRHVTVDPTRLALRPIVDGAWPK